MVRARTGHKRCDTCRLHPSVCICDQLPRIVTRTRLSMIFWHQELFKTTNTGRLVLACLPNSNSYTYAGPEPLVSVPLNDLEQPLLLFPAEDAVPLDQYAASEKPIRLFVPDGTWRQATKICRRLPPMESIPRVTLPEGPASRYTARSNPRQGSVCTMEAIARALGVLEGEQTQLELERVFRTFMDRLNWICGRLAAEHVFGGLPEKAERHNPFSGLQPDET